MGQAPSPDRPTSPHIPAVFTRLGMARSRSIGCPLSTLPSVLRRATGTQTFPTGRAGRGLLRLEATSGPWPTMEPWVLVQVTYARMDLPPRLPILRRRGSASPWTTPVVQWQHPAQESTAPPATHGPPGNPIFA